MKVGVKREVKGSYDELEGSYRELRGSYRKLTDNSIAAQVVRHTSVNFTRVAS